MDDYKKAYERNELKYAMSDKFLDLFDEWSNDGPHELYRRGIDDELLPDDADKARALAIRIVTRLMRVADAIDALNDFDTKHG